MYFFELMFCLPHLPEEPAPKPAREIRTGRSSRQTSVSAVSGTVLSRLRFALKSRTKQWTTYETTQRPWQRRKRGFRSCGRACWSPRSDSRSDRPNRPIRACCARCCCCCCQPRDSALNLAMLQSPCSCSSGSVINGYFALFECAKGRV